MQHPDPPSRRVTAVHRGHVVLDGDDLIPLARALPEAPVVGDLVVLRDGFVHAVLPRETVLAREDGALVANVTLAIIVTSLNHDLNLRRAERFAALARNGGVTPLVALSKGDLHPDPVGAAAEVSAALALEALPFSAVQGWGVPALRARMAPGTVTALLGMSGVGKSTLVNLLLGEEERQRTLAVRAKDDRGRHATTHRELFVLDDGAMLVDTPGLRLPRMATADGVEEAFADVTELARGCRFADCRHEEEPGCAVRGVVADERLASLRKLEREGMTAQERRARSRKIHKQIRAQVRDGTIRRR